MIHSALDHTPAADGQPGTEAVCSGQWAPETLQSVRDEPSVMKQIQPGAEVTQNARMLQMEYLAQKLSAVGIGVAPEILQSVKDELSVETAEPH